MVGGNLLKAMPKYYFTYLLYKLVSTTPFLVGIKHQQQNHKIKKIQETKRGRKKWQRGERGG